MTRDYQSQEDMSKNNMHNSGIFIFWAHIYIILSIILLRTYTTCMSKTIDSNLKGTKPNKIQFSLR